MDISVVTGTHNRLEFLKKMVQSARDSCKHAHGLELEFCIVDGQSEDGTHEWLANQPDVRWISHGALLGACKAFNDGAAMARGQYVILANDDVEFIEDTLPRAWAFMQARPEVGMGCFYQDRGGRDWHVEHMPCVMKGSGGEFRPAHLPYGQVCIVPKELGDRVGWWGDYLKTYGGDNEISANVYETGFKVVPLEGCKIHDNEPDDDLRRINNIDGAHDPRAVRGHNPDSWAWGRKWTERWRNAGRRDLGGPEVREHPTFSINLSFKERILYLPIYEAGWPVQKEQKRGLREALARVGVVEEVDYVGLGKDAAIEACRKACNWLHPTIVLMQIHGVDPLGPQEVYGLRPHAPEAWFVNWNGDFWPDNLLSEDGLALARAFDLQLTVNRSALDEYWKQNINAGYWQIGWEPDGINHEPRKEDRCDVVFLANGYSRERQKLVSQLRAMPYEFRLWGNGWPEGWAVGQSTYDFVSACRAYRGAKFSIGDSQWPDTGFVSNRVMQALAAGGSVLCHQWFRGMDELGLVDGETCIVWYNVQELKEKLAHYGQREEQRRHIAENGERLALGRHSFDARVRELLEMKPGNEEDWR